MKRISKMLSLLLVFAMIVPGIAQAANLESAEGIERIAGPNRWGTAVEVSERMEKGNTVIIANGRDKYFADALAGSALAGALNAPILLTNEGDELVEATKAQLEKLAPEKVILLGGESVISKSVEEELAGYKVERIGEAGRTSTAIAIAKAVVEKTNSKTAILAYGNDFADALAAGPLAASKGMPILLTNKSGNLTEATKTALKDMGIEKVLIVGGTSVVREEIKTELAELCDVERLAHEIYQNRYGTSIAIAEKMGNVDKVIFANSHKPADALAAGPLAAQMNAPIILVKNSDAPDLKAQTDFVKANYEKSLYVVGGEAVMDTTVVLAIEKLVEEAAEEAKELKVVSVSAIKQTIAEDKETALKFEVNDKEYTKATFDETFGEEDYTVEFKFNKGDDFDKARKSGVVKTTEAFKYAVQVFLDGEKVNEVEATDYADVKVVKADEAASIEEVVLSNDRDYVTKGSTDVTFEVTKAKNALGEELDEASLEVLNRQLEKVESDDIKVAYWNDGIVARDLGKVTFKLTYYKGDDAITFELPVEVRKPGVPTTVVADDQKVAAGTKATDLDFKVLDQHGAEIDSGSDYKLVIRDSDNKVVENLDKKGTYTIVVEDTNEKRIGSFKVEVVEVKDADIDEFKIVKADKDAFEIDKDATAKDVTLLVKGYVDGVEVSAAKVQEALENKDGAEYDLVKEDDKDDKVAEAKFNTEKTKITVTPVAAGTTTLEIVKVEGDYEVVLADFEVEVVSKVEAIDKLTLEEDTKVVIGKAERDAAEEVDEETADKNARAVAVVEAVEEEIEAKQIAKVELVEAQGKVIVTITDVFGGKEFTLDAKFLTAEEDAMDVTTDGHHFTETSSEAHLIGATFEDVTSYTVEYYNNETLLSTNNLNVDKYVEQYPNSKRVTAPFGRDKNWYETDEFWGVEYTEDYNDGQKPNKLVITVEFESGKVARTENTIN